jgi:hypothetical protein
MREAQHIGGPFRARFRAAFAQVVSALVLTCNEREVVFGGPSFDYENIAICFLDSVRQNSPPFCPVQKFTISVVWCTITRQKTQALQQGNECVMIR